MDGKISRRDKIAFLSSLLMLWSVAVSAQTASAFKFDFGGQAKDHLQVQPHTSWPSSAGTVTYGLSGATDVRMVERTPSPNSNFLTSSTPFYFSVQVPEGNYRVTVHLGDPEGISTTTIKAESRRLMVYEQTTSLGEIARVSFIVNIRSARIKGSDSIRLKPREYDYLNWDNLLTLEFGGDRPCIGAVYIEPTHNLPTVFLTGNSTVVDQDKEPWASWGQMFPWFLKPEISVANYAESGETLKAFIREKRLDKIASQIKTGDYLFMEFAHNDQKPGGNHVDPYTSYQEYLMKFIELARSRQATPVLVTSTNRRTFNEAGEIENSLGEYPEAMRQLAKQQNVALIDLHAMSKQLYEALGLEHSKRAFVHYPANTFAGQPEALADNTHFSTWGAWKLAKCVVEGIRSSSLDLKSFLKEDLSAFDPADPAPYEKWKWPVSKMTTPSKPEGH